MTPDELRARCRYALDQFDRAVHAKGELDILESLCREMISEGLERAAVEARARAGRVHKNHHMEFKSGHGNACYDLEQWCRQEAQRVKEDVWITEKAAQEDGCRVDAGRIEEAQRVKEGR